MTSALLRDAYIAPRAIKHADVWCLRAVQEIFRFLKNPRKPAILAMSRPDAKKNITTLVKAFGENPTLRELANLVLIMVGLLSRSSMQLPRSTASISKVDA